MNDEIPDDKPRPARGFSFLTRAFRTVFGADHPARRPVTPEGFPLRLIAEVADLRSDPDHTAMLLTFHYDDKLWGAPIRLKPGTTGYAIGDRRPIFLDPERRRYLFGVLTGQYDEAARLIPPVPGDSPPADHPLRVTATVDRVEHWEAQTGTAADLFSDAASTHIWRSTMTLRVQVENRDLGAEIVLPPGNRDHSPGAQVPLDLSTDLSTFRFGHAAGRVCPWSEFDLSGDDDGDAPANAPPPGRVQ